MIRHRHSAEHDRSTHHQAHAPDRDAEHAHRASHGHAHQHDRGITGAVRYLSLLPQMWRSEVGEAVVTELALNPGERVLDLGAGMGSATVAALLTGAAVTAVDPAPFMRGILRLRRRWPGQRKLQVENGAAESIPVTDKSVDALWTVNTIHHWTDRAQAVSEFARVLRPGGRMLLVDEDFDDPSHPLHARIKRRRAGRHAHHFDTVDIDALAKALSEAGFATAQGLRTVFAGRPAKLIRAVR